MICVVVVVVVSRYLREKEKAEKKKRKRDVVKRERIAQNLLYIWLPLRWFLALLGDPRFHLWLLVVAKRKKNSGDRRCRGAFMAHTRRYDRGEHRRPGDEA